MNNQKIPHKVVHIITDLDDGGAEAVLYRLTSAPSSWEHHVISLTDAGKYGNLLTQKRIQIYCLRINPSCPNPFSLYRLWRLIRRLQPDAIQTWMYHADLLGGLCAKFAGIQNIFWGIRNSTLDWQYSKKTTILITRLCAWLSKWIPLKIVCCARKAAHVHQAIGYEQSKCVVIPNGYNIQEFYPTPKARNSLRQAWALPDEQPLIGSVGRFHAQKDYPTLIEALSRLKQKGLPFHCVLVGTNLDEENHQLVSWLEEKDIRSHVTLLGRRNDVAVVMNALDLHILPSAFGEAFPNVLAEAMACGTPCVTTDVGDAAFLVGETGWIVPPRSPDQLADAIEAALGEKLNAPEQWQERQTDCRQRICDHFSLETMAAAYHQLWQEALEGET